MQKRVVGIGLAKVDYLAVVDRYPESDFKVDLSEFSMQEGGVIATALATLAMFKVPVSFVGKLSDDEFGRFTLRGLEGIKIDISNTIRQPGRLSPFAFIVIERETQRRNVFQTNGNIDLLEPTEIDPKIFNDCALLLVDGFHIKSQIWAAEQAHKLGIKVVLDASYLHEGMGELVALSDIMIASERYASEVAPRGEIEDSLIELSRMGPRIVVVTLGREGSIGLEGDKLVHQPALHTKIVDTTGAGDVYLGGYCYGLLQEWPLERCMQIASAAAGISCRALGARAGLPELHEVEAVSWQQVIR